jgi:hypothetical protein
MSEDIMLASIIDDERPRSVEEPDGQAAAGTDTGADKLIIAVSDGTYAQ